MAESVMVGAKYRSSDTIQGAFKYSSHENIAVTIVDALSAIQSESIIILSASDYYYLNINAAATTASILLPPGMTAIIVDAGDVLHFIQKDAPSTVSIINPE